MAFCFGKKKAVPLRNWLSAFRYTDVRSPSVKVTTITSQAPTLTKRLEVVNLENTHKLRDSFLITKYDQSNITFLLTLRFETNRKYLSEDLYQFTSSRQ